ncbi:hypothetical protein [Paraburkholderia sp. UCT2]|uniref:hypothetical protein n=1 Tax=Paraburkholderia sp. UCT2 TaxID=2615208 RepID=UPI001656477E|nr:hypothetical protein [Paraburkholderia sp. UCT2]
MVNPFAAFFRFLDRRTLQHARRLSFRYGIFWLGAVATGLVAVLYAHLIDACYDIFRRVTAVRWWLPFLLTPAIGAASVWITRRFHSRRERQRHSYPARFRAIRGFDLERRLALAGAAAGLSAAFICGSVNATVGDRIAEDLMPPDSSGPWAGMSLSSGSCAAAVACPMARWYADRAEEHFKSRTSFGAGSFALSALGFAASRINW